MAMRQLHQGDHVDRAVQEEKYHQNDSELPGIPPDAASESEGFENRVGDTVVDMCFAGHRYDSTTKPTGRAARWMYALIRTAIQIIRLRPGTEDAQAAHFFWTR